MRIQIRYIFGIPHRPSACTQDLHPAPRLPRAPTNQANPTNPWPPHPPITLAQDHPRLNHSAPRIGAASSLEAPTPPTPCHKPPSASVLELLLAAHWLRACMSRCARVCVEASGLRIPLLRQAKGMSQRCRRMAAGWHLAARRRGLLLIIDADVRSTPGVRNICHRRRCRCRYRGAIEELSNHSRAALYVCLLVFCTPYEPDERAGYRSERATGANHRVFPPWRRWHDRSGRSWRCVWLRRRWSRRTRSSLIRGGGAITCTRTGRWRRVVG